MDTNQIDTDFDLLMNGNFEVLPNLLFQIQTFMEDGDDDGYWIDGIREALTSCMELDTVGQSEAFINFVIELMRFDSHLGCALIYEDNSRNFLAPEQLERMANFPLCKEEGGVSGTCFGLHTLIAMHPKTPTSVLSNLHKDKTQSQSQDDEELINWAIAINPNTSQDLLSELVKSQKFSWRIQSEIEDCDLFGQNSNTNPVIQSYIIWALAGNPSLDDANKQKIMSLDFSTWESPDDSWSSKFCWENLIELGDNTRAKLVSTSHEIRSFTPDY